MPLNFKERQKILKTANTLDLHPIKNHSEEIGEDGLVTIILPKFNNKFAVKFVIPRMKTKSFKIKLDKFGSAVWLESNGKSNVQKIISELEGQFGDEIKPAEERILKFLFQLYEQRLISFNELNK